MGVYIARVSLKYSYADEQLEQLGGFWNIVLYAIPKKFNAELLIYRFTFVTYKMTADNREECREALTKACSERYSSSDMISQILVSDYKEGEDQSDLVRVIYNSYYGVEGYQKLICELAATIPLMAENEAKDIFIRQNYLFAVDQGCGFTTLLCSFGDFMRRMDVFKDEEKEKRKYYAEIKVGNETENGCESEDDIIEKLGNIKENNTYDMLGFDLSYFLEGHKTDQLRRFLRRLQEYENDFVFAFRIPFLEKRAMDDFVNILSDVMIVKVVQIPPLADCVLMECIWNILNEKDFNQLTEIIPMVIEKIHQEKMDGRSYGFKTAEKIAYELIMSNARHVIACEDKGEQIDHIRISADRLDGFLKTGKQKATGYDALSELVGMDYIADRIREIIAQVKVAMKNEKLDRPCIHMRFTGAPGTGKTTVARIIGQIMREEGILRKGGFFEYTGRDLVAEYVGQTAVKTASICRDSYGSVLFIDEAYALYDDDSRQNDFGKEALTTLISEMENHRDDMLVVMAGYTDEMAMLMKGNPGLRSRMPYVLEFTSYTKDQLFDIFMLMVKKHFEYTPELEAAAKEYFTSLSNEYIASKEFANARFVRNLYERTWSKGALRSTMDGTTDIVLEREDFVAASSEKEFSEKIEHQKVIGF